MGDLKLRIKVVVNHCLFAASVFGPLLIGKKSGKHLIIGDSHAGYTISQKPKKFNWSKSGVLSIWLGPKLLYSVAHKGVPLNALTSFILQTIKFQTISFMFGEIDVRVFLARGDKDYAMTHNDIKLFYDKVLATANKLNIYQVIVITPVPPSDFGYDNLEYPTAGSLSERVGAHKDLVAKLKFESPSIERLSILDLCEVLSIEDCTLSGIQSNDGCHLNEKFSKALLDRLSTL